MRLCAARFVIAYEYDVQIWAVTDLVSAKFTERDDGQLLVAEEPGCKNETSFSQIRKLGEHGSPAVASPTISRKIMRNDCRCRYARIGIEIV